MTTDRNPEHLHPNLQIKLARFLEKCAERGIKILIVETFRPQSRQDELWAQGRTAPGPKVTWTRNSRHSYTQNGKPASLAFDAVPLDANGKPAWDDAKAYEIMDRIGDRIGLDKVRGDSPHYQIDL